jgi:hypothetical protein
MSFPRYERYKNSGVEWLGEVPEHWEVVPLKRLADFIMVTLSSRPNGRNPALRLSVFKTSMVARNSTIMTETSSHGIWFMTGIFSFAGQEIGVHRSALFFGDGKKSVL